jgi:hypothetical protein
MCVTAAHGVQIRPVVGGRQTGRSFMGMSGSVDERGLTHPAATNAQVEDLGVLGGGAHLLVALGTAAATQIAFTLLAGSRSGWPCDGYSVGP